MSKLSSMFDRIEISSLLSQHMTTFYHYEKRKFYNKTEVPFSDKIIFLIAPILVSILLCFSGLKFNREYVNIALTSLSIFTGLLFTLLTMILGLVQENAKTEFDKVPATEKRQTLAKIDLTKHLFVNTAFSIVLSILALFFVLSTQFYPSRFIDYISTFSCYSVIKNLYLYSTNGLSFFLLIEFLLTILMILKRFAVLFLNIIE